VSIGWAVIGTGRVAAHTARAIGDADGAHAVAVLSRDADRGRSFAARHRIPVVRTSLTELVADADVDVVYVASPNGLHRDHTVAAARAGKHVLCEKPMSTDVEACRTMVEACRRHAVELGLAFQYRQHRATAAMRELAVSGRLGSVVLADAAVCVPPLATPGWYADPSLAEGGVLPMSGVHRIDLLRFVLGSEVSEVSAFTGPQVPSRPYEEAVAAVLRFDSGTIATVRCAMNLPHGSDPVALHGTAGSAEAVRTTSQWWGGDGGQLVVRLDGGTETRAYEKEDLYRRQVESFGARLRGERSAVATGLDGLRAAEVTAAIYRASSRGATVPVERTGG